MPTSLVKWLWNSTLRAPSPTDSEQRVLGSPAFTLEPELEPSSRLVEFLS